ncbi:hypothetical protein FBU30_004880 [Linnemannia zychae]|nr:hypothetical protein FBU30_004880 [Linnemannia zychae]
MGTHRVANDIEHREQSRLKKHHYQETRECDRDLGHSDMQYESRNSSSLSPDSLTLPDNTSLPDVPHPLMFLVDVPSSSSFSLSSASASASASASTLALPLGTVSDTTSSCDSVSAPKPHRLDLSFGKSKGNKGGGKCGVIESIMKNPASPSLSSPHGGSGGGGRSYLRRVWSKIKHQHGNCNGSGAGGGVILMVAPKKSQVAQALA